MSMRILVIEDGTEYVECFVRFLADFQFERAGSGPQALTALEQARAEGRPYEAVVLDMRFDRAPQAELLGDIAEAAERFGGDVVKGRHFLEEHQGTYVLSALRTAGHRLPVLMSHDFSAEPRRWERLSAKHAPLAFVPDSASPADIGQQLRELVGR
jgi:CheY-like chemotaxis protein